MIDEQLKGKEGMYIMLAILLIAVVVLIFAGARASKIYNCRKQGMILQVEPKVRCVTQQEIDEFKNGTGTDWYDEIENFSGLGPVK